MAIKFTPQGSLIYLAMLVYLVALLVRLAGRKDASIVVFGLGFVAAAASWGFRWRQVGHIPLANLFEVFLFLGMAVFPLAMFCRHFLGAGSEAADMFLAALVLVPAGFVFDAAPRRLIPALQSPFFIPHVLAYLLAYVVMAKAAVEALAGLVKTDTASATAAVSHDAAAYRLVRLGFPLLTMGLVLGSVWGKLAWGDYWNWDPKELWSLASWLVYVGYLHLRSVYGAKHKRLNAALVIAGMVTIVVTLLWVNLARLFSGLHSYA